MKRHQVLWVSIVMGCLILFSMFLAFYRTSLKTPVLEKPLQRHIALGVWTEGLFDAPTQKLQPKKLLAFEKLIQKKVSIAHYYIGWEALTTPSLLTQFDTLAQNGWTPMLNVNPYYFSECPATELQLYKAIAEGKCDDFLQKAAQNIKQVKQPFYLLFAWEMNNPNNAWSVATTGSKSEDFIAAWRHMHDIFKQEHATNVMWVFCPNVPDDATVSYSSLYPGDAYVDWIGLDGYNWGTTQSWSQWTNFAGVFTDAYKELTTLAPSKPIMIAEVNTTSSGGDKGAWYIDMFAKQIPYTFPKIAAVVIFNEDRGKQENVNWKIDESGDSLRGFITGVHTEFY